MINENPRQADAFSSNSRVRHSAVAPRRQPRHRQSSSRARSRRRRRTSRSPSSSAAATSSAAQSSVQRGMDRGRADYMGMLGTVMNALALQDFLEQAGRCDARAVGDRDDAGRRAVHPAARRAAPGEGPHRHLRRRRRPAVLLDRHRRAQRALEIGADGGARRQERRRRRLRLRPAHEPEGREARRRSPTRTRSCRASRSSTRPRSACAWTTGCPWSSSAWSRPAT